MHFSHSLFYRDLTPFDLKLSVLSPQSQVKLQLLRKLNKV